VSSRPAGTPSGETQRIGPSNRKDAAALAGSHRFPPSTRYQGSKRKLLGWIGEQLAPLEFRTALDLFSGTASVAYLLKSRGISVTCNDYLQINWQIATALVENSSVRLDDEDLDFLTRRHADVAYDDFIARTFRGIYFTDEENVWLDVVAQNIPRMADRYRQALAWYAVAQACLRKRPYNLFHRSNLYMRTASVVRRFGNKVTWDSPFDTQFRHFAHAANEAVFETGATCRAMCRDALAVEAGYDLVYIDPPYVSGRGKGVDYFGFYHFLEGMLDYPNWGDRIDLARKHRPLAGLRSVWSDARTIRDAFAELLERHRDSILVISYRSDGIPSESELLDLLRAFKQDVRCVEYGAYQYALSTNRRSRELLLIGR